MTEDSIIDLVQQHRSQGGDPPPAEPNNPSQDMQNAAMMRKAQVMSESIPEDSAIEEALEGLLTHVKNKMAWTVVQLPSRGLLYEDGTTEVKLRPFTFADEKMLKSIPVNSDGLQVIDKLLENCVEGVDTHQLTPADRLYVLFRLRGISYGDDYKITHDCLNCGHSSELTLGISTLTATPLTQEHMLFVLPDSEQEVEIKLPRTQDENLFSSNEMLMQNMHMFIRRVGAVADPLVIEAFVQKTTVRDIDTLRRHIYMPDYGMETHFFYSCNGCAHKNRVEIGLNENFFTAS